MKSYWVSIVAILMSIQFATAQSETIKRPFPREVNYKVKFELPMAEFEEGFSKEKLTLDNSYGFRVVYTQDVDRRNVSEIVYYFDSDGDKPLYELIVVYRDPSTAATIASRRFGEPNFRENEWRFRYKEHDIWCWVYENKIVIAARIPGTEWYDEWD